MTELQRLQAATASRFGTDAVEAHGQDKVGVARNVGHGVLPLNALRHPTEDGSSGWVIWAGEEISSDPDFFLALHVSHLGEWCPEILPYLALPPGWRVLIAPGYEDVWFDETIL
jgi:hypothetical protein